MVTVSVADLTKRPDIIRRAFRGTGVGIDIKGKMRHFLRFPGFETYDPPGIGDEHIDDVLTEQEIKALEKKEMKFQEKQKKRKQKKKLEENRKRAGKRTKYISRTLFINSMKLPTNEKYVK